MAAAPQRLFVHRWVHDLCGARRGPELLRRRMRVDVVEEVHAPLLQLHVEPREVQYEMSRRDEQVKGTYELGRRDEQVKGTYELGRRDEQMRRTYELGRRDEQTK